ncbi:class I SAM-dependent methyltransferase [Paenibacillus thermoaerophilus]|uniref:Class I SAM-dependent methyltransferase n=1 Tax=Paenibacillus thermoaerophilus TaxID=1215385 RepID=A0ABW2VAH2_9BACL|nr:methyltransferase [Paenibacillus thermoaerophilus]
MPDGKSYKKKFVAANEMWLFLTRFLRDPRQVGSVLPSSRYLAKAMVGEIEWARTRAVAELGAGTGAITGVMMAAKPPGTKVFLFEKDDRLRQRLQQDFRDCICCADASEMARAMRSQNVTGLDCVVSGLPFFNFPAPVRESLLGQVASALDPGGQFIAFQYSLQLKPHLTRYFRIEKIKMAPWNVPPAFVFVCRKKEGVS